MLKDIIKFICLCFCVIISVMAFCKILNWGVSYLIYKNETPYKTTYYKVGKFENNDCQKVYDNLIDKTNYECVKANDFDF